MLSFILLVVVALIFGYFATQNSTDIPITLAGYTFPSIPLYIVLGITFLIGLSFSWINSLIDSFSFAMKMRGKEHTIKDARKSLDEQTRKITQLENENAKLRKELKKTPTQTHV